MFQMRRNSSLYLPPELKCVRKARIACSCRSSSQEKSSCIARKSAMLVKSRSGSTRYLSTSSKSESSTPPQKMNSSNASAFSP